MLALPQPGVNMMKLRLLPLWLGLLLGCRSATPAKTDPPADAVAEHTYLTLGGSPQYVEITSASARQPVLLFIHGGPGWPQTPMLRSLNADLPTGVTLVSWDQRGAGLSYLRDSMPGNVTLDQIVADGHELTRYLQQRFHQRKIYLAGFSWGSIIGVRLAQQYPEDYAGYIGTGQVVNVRRGVSLSREWLRGQMQAAGDTAGLRVLADLGRAQPTQCHGDMACFIVMHGLLEHYHGATYQPGSNQAVEAAMKRYPDYAAYNWDRGFEFSAEHLEGDLFNTDLTGVRHLEVPVTLLLGRHDWNVPSVLAAEWLDSLTAPRKKLVWFEQSGHGPLEEEPARFDSVLLDAIHP
jgi:pimeloyl-ACP methyl ester carboxylesterase